MAETGRCWYCGSEDVEDYSDGSHECLECGMTWGEQQYVHQQVEQPRYRRIYSDMDEDLRFERAMRPYREKWRKHRPNSSSTAPFLNNKGKKWYESDVQVSNGCAIPVILYIIIAIVVYGSLGFMLYISCSS